MLQPTDVWHAPGGAPPAVGACGMPQDRARVQLPFQPQHAKDASGGLADRVPRSRLAVGSRPVVVRACERVLGESRIVGASYATDAAIYAEAGIPCIVLGPGDIRLAHTDHESISLDELEKAVGVYLAIMRGE